MRAIKVAAGILLVAVLTAGCAAQRRDTHELLNGLLWVQTSAEYQTLVAVTYREARTALEKIVAEAGAGRFSPSAAVEQPGTNERKLPLAVVVDVDETILNNSPMSGRLIAERRIYNGETWSGWVALEKAAFLPQAQAFIEAAQAAGVTVFYVTNRTEAEEAHTLRDLEPLQVTDATLLTVDEMGEGESTPWDGEKAARRSYIARTHWIVAMVGDDLADFIPRIRSMNPQARREESAKHVERFGTQWFLLPNPLYGSWERTLYDRDDSDAVQLEKKIAGVERY